MIRRTENAPPIGQLAGAGVVYRPTPMSGSGDQRPPNFNSAGSSPTAKSIHLQLFGYETGPAIYAPATSGR